MDALCREYEAALVTSYADLEARLASLADRHRSPGVRQREALEARRCTVPGCSSDGPTRLFMFGRRCGEHSPAQPDPAASRPAPPPPRPPREYGTATTDPLGREGTGWRVSDQTRLPVRAEE